MNIYIKAMEIGYNNPEGITYHDLKDEIERSLMLKIEGQMEYSFIVWFVNNFSSSEFSSIDRVFFNKIREYIYGRYGENTRNKRAYDRLRNLFFIKGETLKQYIDYLELSHAKKSSRKAFTLSIISIIIAIVSLLVTLVIQLVHSYPEPPYEVIVVDNKKELTNKDIDSFKSIKIKDALKKIDSNYIKDTILKKIQLE